jgi:hypothetical protein
MVTTEHLVRSIRSNREIRRAYEICIENVKVGDYLETCGLIGASI